MQQYLVTIEDPLEIIAAVYETKQRADEDQEPVEVLLDHQEEPNVVRGYGEPLLYRDGEAMDGSTVRRPDGGLSWYHSHTGCYMRATPGTTDIAGIDEARQEWMDEVTALAEEAIGGPVDDDSMDVYAAGGRQVMGASSDHRDLSDPETGYRGDADLQRACWYDADPDDPALDRLLERDGIDPDDFYDSITTADGLLDLLEQRKDPEDVHAPDFVSAESMEMAEQLQERDEGGIEGSCVMSDYLEDE